MDVKSWAQEFVLANLSVQQGFYLCGVIDESHLRHRWGKSTVIDM
jgi:hypothetical protein